MYFSFPARLLIVPGLRDHVDEHWQTRLAEAVPGARTVPPLSVDRLSRAARVAALDQALAEIDGPVILVAHSAGVLTVAHWAAQHHRPIAGALLATPPDPQAVWPDKYPSPQTLAEQGWLPLPRRRLPFPSIVASSSDDPLATPQAVRAMAEDWGSELVELGAVGHLNPASGYGPWPGALPLIARLAAVVK